jgi:hypothetical protein
MTGNKIKANKMGIFVSTVRHNYDQKTATENKIQNNVRQYKIGEYSRDITKYDFFMCGVLQVFPKKKGGKKKKDGSSIQSPYLLRYHTLL